MFILYKARCALTGAFPLLSIIPILLLSACVAPPEPEPEPLTRQNSALTQGNIQLNLIVGTTTKSDILETFGGPNITTRDGSGREVWTYQRVAQVSQSSGQLARAGVDWTIIFGSKISTASGSESSSRMTTLIIKFDANDIVSDFRSRTSTF